MRSNLALGDIAHSTTLLPAPPSFLFRYPSKTAIGIPPVLRALLPKKQQRESCPPSSVSQKVQKGLQPERLPIRKRLESCASFQICFKRRTKLCSLDGKFCAGTHAAAGRLNISPSLSRSLPLSLSLFVQGMDEMLSKFPLALVLFLKRIA